MISKGQLALGVAVSGVTLVGVGIDVSGAFAAPSTHTLVYKTAVIKHVYHPKTATEIATSSLSKGGTVVGLDLANCHVTKSHDDCKEAFSVTGGLIYGQYTGTPNNISGVITGGTGKFKNASGTIHAVFEKHHRGAIITLKYHG